MVYHGREILRANPILKETVKPGPRALYGEGIHYAQGIHARGKILQNTFQNRVNSDRYEAQTGTGADYWLSKTGDALPGVG